MAVISRDDAQLMSAFASRRRNQIFRCRAAMFELFHAPGMFASWHDGVLDRESAKNWSRVERTLP